MPEESRQGWMSLTVVLFGFTFFSATMMAGGQLGKALGYGAGLAKAVLVGNLLLAVYAAALSYVAFRSGLSTVLMSRHCFGARGSALADLVLGLTQVGWYAWGTDTVATVLIQTFHRPSELYVPMVLLAGLGFSITATIGYKGLEVLSATTVPLMAGLIFWSGYIALAHPSTPGGGGGEMTLSQAVTIVVGTFVSGATQSTNWTRYSRTATSSVVVTFLAFFLGNGLMVGYGALAGSVYQNSDVVAVLILQGLFAPALFMLLANIWTTQDNTIYNFSLAGCHFFRTERRRLVTFLGAVLGTLLALFGFSGYLVPFLLALGTSIPPVGGVILADFFYCRRGAYPSLASVHEAWMWQGLTAYAGGLAAAWWLPGIAPVNGVLTAFLLQALLMRRSEGRLV